MESARHQLEEARQLVQPNSLREEIRMRMEQARMQLEQGREHIEIARVQRTEQAFSNAASELDEGGAMLQAEGVVMDALPIVKLTQARSELALLLSTQSDTANRALLITTLSVVVDPSRTVDPCSATPGDENRAWTIGHMLKREAEKRGVDPSAYVSNWMNAWTGTVDINGQAVPPLLGPNVETAWHRFAGNTTLPLHKAPFFLLAIANRPDLRKHRPLGEPLGGEVRFVFGIQTPQVSSPPCPTLSSDPVSTIILEYSPAKADENQVRDFASRWLALSSLTGTAYLSALEALTEEVINQGQLLRIRTNDGPIAGKVGGVASGWDFGEFEHNSTTQFLERSTMGRV